MAKKQAKVLMVILLCVAIGFTVIIYQVAASKGTSSSGDSQSVDSPEISVVINTPTSTTQVDSQIEQDQKSRSVSDAEFYASLWGITPEEAATALANPLKGEEAIMAFAEIYADYRNVTIDDALVQMKLERVAGQLDHALQENEGDIFAGLWIHHEPDFRVVISFTKDGEKTIQPYIEDNPLMDIIELRTADNSLMELQHMRWEAEKSLYDAGITISASDLNIRGNRIELYVRDRTEIDAAIEMKKVILPQNVDVVMDSGFSQTSLFGGLGLDYDDGVQSITDQCTAGFSVIQNSGDGIKGLSTVDHVDVGLGYLWLADGTHFTPLGGAVGGSYDTQWGTIAGHVVLPYIWTGATFASIDGTLSRSGQSIGMTVCKYGVETRGAVGDIISTTYRPSDYAAPGTWGEWLTSATYIRLHNDSTDLCEPGDSGGPCFSVSTAYGTIVGQHEDDCIYMAINYLESVLNVSVMTSTTPDTDVTIQVSLQGENRPVPEGYEIPLSIRFWASNTTWGPGAPPDPADYTLYYDFSGTASYNYNGGNPVAEYVCEAIPSGTTYDISVDSTTTLMNIKDNVYIP